MYAWRRGMRRRSDTTDGATTPQHRCGESKCGFGAAAPRPGIAPAKPQRRCRVAVGCHSRRPQILAYAAKFSMPTAAPRHLCKYIPCTARETERQRDRETEIPPKSAEAHEIQIQVTPILENMRKSRVSEIVTPPRFYELYYAQYVGVCIASTTAFSQGSRFVNSTKQSETPRALQAWGVLFTCEYPSEKNDHVPTGG